MIVKKNLKILSLLLVTMLFATSLTTTLAAPVTQEEGTIVDIAAGDEQFSTLVTALQAAGLVETLQGEGPLTASWPTSRP